MKPIAVYDTEVYKNYFLLAFMDLETRRVATFELPLDKDKILKIFRKYTAVGFNSRKYDNPMIVLALNDFKNLKQASDLIIQQNMQPWQVEDKFGINPLQGDFIDLIEVAPGIASLKTYGGRLHTHHLQDLPYEHDKELTDEEKQVVKDYCCNDLQITADLYEYLLPQIKLREDMSRIYNIDLRSKSDAQIAEAVIKRLLKEHYGIIAVRPTLPKNHSFFYKAPLYLKNKLNGLVREIETIVFSLDDKGSVVMPELLKSRLIKIGDSEYRMGIGGLHSTESCLSIDADDMILEDRDVASYYPSLIINNGYYPPHLSEAFLSVYKKIYNERLAAKKAGDKTRSDVMKITLNGTFGKLGSKWSIFYAPEMLIQVTITGQLSLLWLIDMLEESGVKVVSANTDGIVLYYPKTLIDKVNEIIASWESDTGLATESTPYKSIHNRDVNSYINVKTDGNVKTKGAYALEGLAKNPHGDIAILAAIEYLKTGKSISETIYNCKDIRKFIFVRKVEGGAVKDGDYLGKSVRWYYGVNETTPLNYAKNGNKVSESDGGKPLMTLPENFPEDVDYNRYIQTANEILCSIGVKNDVLDA